MNVPFPSSKMEVLVCIHCLGPLTLTLYLISIYLSFHISGLLFLNSCSLLPSSVNFLFDSFLSNFLLWIPISPWWIMLWAGYSKTASCRISSPYFEAAGTGYSGDRILNQVNYQNPYSVPASDTPPPDPGTNCSMQSMPEAAREAAWAHICQPYTSPALREPFFRQLHCISNLCTMLEWRTGNGGQNWPHSFPPVTIITNYPQMNGDAKRTVPVAKWILCQKDPLIALSM